MTGVARDGGREVSMKTSTRPKAARPKRRAPSMRTLDVAAIAEVLTARFDELRDEVKDAPMDWPAARVIDELAPMVAELARAARPYNGDGKRRG